MKLFKRSIAVDLPVAMSGVKLADRLLVIGCGDPVLIARLAVKVGLTGRACAVDDSPERVAEAARVVEREGALIETAEAPGLSVPYESDAFDLVVIRNDVPPAPDRRARATGEAHRLLRRGGRCLVIEGVRRTGVAGWFGRAGASSGGDPEETSRAITSAGFAAVRTLAEREGLIFVEGVKKNE